MRETIYTRFYVARYVGSPRGEYNEFNEWELCRDEDGIPRHWGDRAGAEYWIDGECDGSIRKRQYYTIVEKRVSFSTTEPATILDIHSLLIDTDIEA